MLNCYDYLFYKFYKWSVRVNGKDYFNEASAALMMSVPMVFILASVAMIVSACYEVTIQSNLEMPIVLALGLFNISLHYWYFKRGGRARSIIARFESEGPRQQKIGNILVALYPLSSFALMNIVGLMVM